MLSVLKEYTTDFYRLFFPKICGACDCSLVKSEEHLCLHCKLELPFTEFELLKENPVEQVFFGRADIDFASALLFFSKGEKVQRLLHNIKYNEQKELALYMGRLMGQRLQNSPYFRGVTTIIPIPLHPQKQNIRGYNQSYLIALGINEVLKIDLQNDNLVREINTSSQTRKSRLERWENVSDTFKLKDQEKVNKKHVLLIDDVLTTGATLDACAQIFKTANGCKVSIATMAFVD